jgi:dihydroflavonol-4-reductase
MVKLMEQGGSGERYILAGENLGYKELFALLSKSFGRPEPSLPLPAWALQLAWRAERIRTYLLGGRAFVTRSTVHTALSHRSYDASKAMRAGVAFRTAEQAVANVAAFVKASVAH